MASRWRSNRRCARKTRQGHPLGTGIPVTVAVEGATLSGTITVETGSDGVADVYRSRLERPVGQLHPGLLRARPRGHRVQSGDAESHRHRARGQWTDPVDLADRGRAHDAAAQRAGARIRRIRDPPGLGPRHGHFTAVPAPANLFCAGHALLPDGRVFLAGGHIDETRACRTSRSSRRHESSGPRSRRWLRGRWYRRPPSWGTVRS